MKPPIDKYTSRGRTISKSTSHKGYYIIDSGDTFHMMACSDEMIKVLHPPDIKIQTNLKAA